MEHFFNTLSSLKHDLTPDPHFVIQSKKVILQTQKISPKKEFYMSQCFFRIRETMSYSFALGITVLIVFIVTNGITGQGLPDTIAQNEKKENLSFNIHLDNAQYYEKASSNVYVVVRDDNKKEIIERSSRSE